MKFLLTIIDKLGTKPHLVIPILIGLVLFSTIESVIKRWQANNTIENLQDRVSDLILDVAKKDSIATAVIAENDNLADDLEESQSNLADIARELELADAQNTIYANTVATLETRLEGLGTVIQAPGNECTGCLMVGDVVAGTIEDPVFHIGWEFRPMDHLVLDPMRARIELELLTTQMPNGGLRVFGKAKDERVRVAFPVIEFKPSSAPVIKELNWWAAFKTFLAGFGLGFIGSEIF